MLINLNLIGQKRRLFFGVPQTSSSHSLRGRLFMLRVTRISLTSSGYSISHCVAACIFSPSTNFRTAAKFYEMPRRSPSDTTRVPKNASRSLNASCRLPSFPLSVPSTSLSYSSMQSLSKSSSSSVNFGCSCSSTKIDCSSLSSYLVSPAIFARLIDFSRSWILDSNLSMSDLSVARLRSTILRGVKRGVLMLE